MGLGGSPTLPDEALGWLLTAAPGLLADDHSRILLKPENSHSNSDYINASPIVSTPSSGSMMVRHREGREPVTGLGQAERLDSGFPGAQVACQPSPVMVGGSEGPGHGAGGGGTQRGLASAWTWDSCCPVPSRHLSLISV